ncbi:FliM/FliN family flagellar motor switch protein [Pelagerythrobacter marensis]|uniref:Flagellar motor switch protein FliN n=1 Tax=Pelagerythrobacter marensis TaxID=543877 RepID=A0A0G3XBI6_9SPHN|nr:FliM/FliN family flagellar motor switch protein [Pelagerythrobacter marensis]AKM07974.1 Flagellar motor switch protein FliN [Pelagerythrobacter marensis]
MVDDQSPQNISTSSARRFVDHVNVEVDVFLGGARLTIAEMTALAEGSVLEVDRLISEAVDIRVNGKVIGRGEIVTIGDKFGVRVTQIGE